MLGVRKCNDMRTPPNPAPRRVIARRILDGTKGKKQTLDFLARLHTVYGSKILAVSGAKLIASDRTRY